MLATVVRLFLTLSFLGLSASGLAQQPVSFNLLDGDASGALSRGEFGDLPGRYADPELFADLDRNGDRSISRDEWSAGSPDASGIPLGSRAIVRDAARQGAARVAPPTFVQHGPSVPILESREPDEAFDVSKRPSTTGRGGANQSKRGVPVRPATMPSDDPAGPGDGVLPR